MEKSLKQDRFIKKSKIVHGDKYNYSLVDYIDRTKNVKIICPEHGIFEQRPDTHLKGGGCKKSFREKISSNTENFIK